MDQILYSSFSIMFLHLNFFPSQWFSVWCFKCCLFGFGFGLPTMLFQCLSGWSIDFNYEKLLLWLLVVVIIIMERNGCPHIHIFQHRLLFVIKFQCFFFLNILLPMENQAKLRLGMFLLLFVLVCLSLELNRKKKLSAHIEFDSYDDHYVSIIIHTIVKLMHTSF